MLSKDDEKWIEDYFKEKNMEDTFNRYQWSRFVGGRDGDQVVVRGSDFNTFLEDVELMKKNFTDPADLLKPPTREFQPRPATPEPDGVTAFCSLHNKPMKQRFGKSGNTWFDHRMQNEAGEWIKCNGKGFK